MFEIAVIVLVVQLGGLEHEIEFREKWLESKVLFQRAQALFYTPSPTRTDLTHRMRSRTVTPTSWTSILVVCAIATSCATLVSAHGGDDDGHATVIEGDGTYAEIHMAQEVSQSSFPFALRHILYSGRIARRSAWANASNREHHQLILFFSTTSSFTASYGQL